MHKPIRSSTLAALSTLLLLALSASRATAESVGCAKQDCAQTPILTAWQQFDALSFPPDQRVAFRELRQTRLQKRPREQSGELWIEADGSFVMQVLQPRAEQRRLRPHATGAALQLIRGDRVRSTTLNPNRGAHQLLLTITHLLQGNAAELERAFTAEPAEPGAHPDRWRWQLTPRAAELRSELSHLFLEGSDDRLLVLRAERGGSWQELVLLPERRE